MKEIIDKLIKLFETCGWIYSGIYDENENTFVLLTNENEGFGLKYINSELEMVIDEEDEEDKRFADEYFKKYTMEDFKNQVKELFKRNSFLCYMIFTVLELEELKIIDKKTGRELCRQIARHEKEILQYSKRYHSWIE